MKESNMKKVKFLVCVRDKNTGEIYQPGDIREFDDERAGELLIHIEATEEVACEKPKKKAKVKDEK